jgi:hypothetical protein
MHAVHGVVVHHAGKYEGVRMPFQIVQEGIGFGNTRKTGP